MCFCLLQELEGLPVVLGNVAFHEIDAPLLEEVERILYQRQGLETEEVHFDQAAVLKVIHCILSGNVARLGVFVERNEVREFGFSDDDAGRVDGAVPVQVLEPQAYFEEFLVARILRKTAKFRLHVEGCLEGHLGSSG